MLTATMTATATMVATMVSTTTTTSLNLMMGTMRTRMKMMMLMWSFSLLYFDRKVLQLYTGRAGGPASVHRESTPRPAEPEAFGRSTGVDLFIAIVLKMFLSMQLL